MDAFGGFPKVRAIFYAEFHTTQGPKVCFEYPEGSTKAALTSSSTAPSISGTTPESLISNVVPTESVTSSDPVVFDSISEYVIPKPELCGRLVKTTTLSHTIMGFPVSLEDTKYERNALIFNLCFVFGPEDETAAYGQVVRKMARVLKSLEIESEFLSHAETKAGLQTIIEQIYDGLNDYHECRILINEANTINLKLFPRYKDPPIVHDYDVPLAVIQLDHLVDKYWDMTMRRIIPFINGVHSVKIIADIADVDIALVRLACQHLLYYGYIKIVDIFQFSNVYVIKPNISRLFQDNFKEIENGSETYSLPAECQNFVTIPGRPKPSFARIFQLYCSLKHGHTIAQWLEHILSPLMGRMEDHERDQSNPIDDSNSKEDLSIHWIHDIDIRRFIIFGVIKGFLHRVHIFPVLPLSSELYNDKFPSGDHELWKHSTDQLRDGSKSSNLGLKKYLNGRNSLDQLCTYFSKPAKQLEQTLWEMAPETLYISK